MRHDLRSCAEHTCAESRGAAWPRCRPVREKLSESGNSPHGLQVRPRLAAGGWSHDAARRDRASSPGLRGPIINSRCQNGNTGSAAIRTRLGRRARRRPRSPRSAPRGRPATASARVPTTCPGIARWCGARAAATSSLPTSRPTAAARNAAPSCTRACNAHISTPASVSNACRRSRFASRRKTRATRVRFSSRSGASSARPDPPRRAPRAPARRSTTCSNRPRPPCIATDPSTSPDRSVPRSATARRV